LYQWLYVKDSCLEWLEARVMDIVLPLSHRAKNVMKRKEINKKTIDGRVIDVDIEGYIHIHYVGWKKMYDEFFSYMDCMNPKSTLSLSRLRPYQSEMGLIPFCEQIQSYTFNWINGGLYIPSDYITGVDVLDCTNKWFTAKLISFAEFPDGPMFLVSFNGWDPKFNGSSIIASFYFLKKFHSFLFIL